LKTNNEYIHSTVEGGSPVDLMLCFRN